MFLNKLKVKYYIRYVDDFIILHKNKILLQFYKWEISRFVKNLNLELHPDKSKIIALRNGVEFLGYRIFYHYKLLRKSNLRKFEKDLFYKIGLYKENIMSKEDLLHSLQGWFGYAIWANTYNLRRQIIHQLEAL